MERRFAKAFDERRGSLLISPAARAEVEQSGASQIPTEHRVSTWMNSDHASSLVLAAFKLVISRLPPDKRAIVECLAIAHLNMNSRVVW